MRNESYNHPYLQQLTRPVAAPSNPSPCFAQSGSPSHCQRSSTPAHGSVKPSHGPRPVPSFTVTSTGGCCMVCYEGNQMECKGLHTLASMGGRKKKEKALGTEDIFLLASLCSFKQNNQKSGRSPLATHSITTERGRGGGTILTTLYRRCRCYWQMSFCIFPISTRPPPRSTPQWHSRAIHRCRPVPPEVQREYLTPGCHGELSPPCSSPSGYRAANPRSGISPCQQPGFPFLPEISHYPSPLVISMASYTE